MLEITFKYRDWLSNFEWKTQHCTVDSIEECIRIYGLNDSDIEYEFIKIENPYRCEYNNEFINNEDKIINCLECKGFNWCKEIHK